ncbi:bifunctional 2-polyprenyl-6-hydroxyphenol methylase/3-demethylubiquinol 3-O-methyltransferase UbiG [Streptomyces sp. DH37]|uniref:class I SAM-dependent methyltransferase n=1 Tax=Streptomyces sp. DH37 TaxID=3040122 RepID=UPI002442EADF|nr:class I SAM-dependent methyltransferase [Streptomyces sp. DH37]MDG9702876.1 class I SAM-dependent methyltransferase [Streptomyces sp. DH37]
MNAARTPSPGGNGYADYFPGGDQSEACRLRALSAGYDPASRAVLQPLVLQARRILDLGSGPGHLVRWIADVTSGKGSVHAVDLDISAITPGAGLTAQQADITAPDFDPGRFDIVHARFTLGHIPAREDVLRRMYSWTRPGGWIVVSDFAELGTPAPTSAYEQVLVGLCRTMAHIAGSDMNFGRRHAASLASLGLRNIGLRADTPAFRAKTPLADFWSATISKVQPQIQEHAAVSAATIKDALSELNDPDRLELSLPMITSWGQRQ